jgi:hypothetical protein
LREQVGELISDAIDERHAADRARFSSCSPQIAVRMESFERILRRARRGQN